MPDERTIGPAPPDPGFKNLFPPALTVSALGVALPDRPPLERLAALALLACASLAFAAQVRGHRAHAPVALALAVATVSDSANAALRATVLLGGPYFSWHRAAFHLHEALTLLPAVVLPLAAGRVYLRGRRCRLLRTGVVSLALALFTSMIAGYAGLRSLPVVARAEWLQFRYLAAEVVSLSIAGAVLVRSRSDAVRVPTATAHTLACLVVGGFTLLVVGAWGRDLFGPGFSAHQAGLAALYLVVALVHVAALWRGGRGGG